MKNIISVLLCILAIAPCGVEANNNCLGGVQLEGARRYECLDTNAYLALSLVQTKTSNYSKVDLYKIDDELLLNNEAADYVLIISSLDIGEPAILVGFKFQGILRFGKESDVSKGVYKLESYEGRLVFDILFKDYETLKIISK